MAKTIKFNLICDNKPVRTIEDLQNNFSIEDVLAYYDNRLLHRWLEVRGYEEELEKVKAIRAEESIEIVKELIRIFNVVSDNKKIEESVYIFKYLENRKQSYSNYERQNYEIRSITNGYIREYRNLVNGILENPQDVAVIKANITEMVSNYSWLIRLDHRNLFFALCGKSSLAVMCLLMNNKLRKYYLPVPEESGIFAAIGKSLLKGLSKCLHESDYEEDDYGVGNDDDRKDMFRRICNMVLTADFRKELGDNLKVFSGMTEEYWKDLEPKGKKCMIISIGNGDFVRASGNLGGDMGYADITDKFVIVDGIDYKSNSSTRELLYMEV